MSQCPSHALKPPPGTGVAPRPAAPAAPVRRGARAQLAVFLAAYLVYDAARWIFSGDLDDARVHADWVIDLERSAHVAIEASVQRALDAGAVSWLLSNVYLAAQLVVLPVALVWLYRTARPVYRRLRDTVIATWLIAIPIFALFPVAPPRRAGIGIVDTVSRQAGVGLTGRSTLFYNPFAAVPSLHVGFAFAIGAAAAVAVHAPWAKALALLWGPLVTLSVLATGNHYVFDVVAGLLVTAAGFAVGRASTRFSNLALQGASP
jgi:membrane-associated phospholipid phosphatase